MSSISSLSASLQAERHALRKSLRAKRRALSATEQHIAAENIIAPAFALIEQHRAQHIAFYLPFDGEISPFALMERLWAAGKQLYLPIVESIADGQLSFQRFNASDRLVTNAFGILEPEKEASERVPLSALEMAFIPLVGCDLAGNRLGMGGGFYDRALSQAPKLIRVGLAHRCQQVPKLPLADWDEPLDHLLLG